MIGLLYYDAFAEGCAGQRSGGQNPHRRGSYLWEAWQDGFYFAEGGR